MNRKDIETFAAIQNRLYGYARNVLTTLAKDYPEVGISDTARPVGLDVIGEYLQVTYSGYPCNSVTKRQANKYNQFLHHCLGLSLFINHANPFAIRFSESTK